MLVLSRKIGESIQIGDQIKLTLLDIKGNRARVGIEAPRDIHIVRDELREIPNQIAAVDRQSPSRRRRQKTSAPLMEDLDSGLWETAPACSV